MKRSILALVALWVLLVAVATMHTYGDISTPNAGIYWRVGGHWCGVEYRGNVGAFCDVT